MEKMKKDYASQIIKCKVHCDSGVPKGGNGENGGEVIFEKL